MFLFRGATARVLVALVLIQSFFLSPGFARSAARDSLALSSADLTQLYRGEIVFKNRLPSAGATRRGNGGTAVVLLQADADEVWQVLTDFSHYAGLFPRLKESELLDQNGAHTLVRFRVSVGPFNFRFFVTHVVSLEERKIRWYLDQSRTNDLFRDTWGYWRLDPIPGGGVLVTYAMASRTVLPAFLTSGAERESVVKTVAALKARVEGVEENVGTRL